MSQQAAPVVFDFCFLARWDACCTPQQAPSRQQSAQQPCCSCWAQPTISHPMMHCHHNLRFAALSAPCQPRYPRSMMRSHKPRVSHVARSSNAGENGFEIIGSSSPELAATAEGSAPSSTTTNPFQAISAAYAVALEQDPVRTKAITSLVGFMVGDLCAQLLTPGAFDVARVLRLGAYGCFLDGPVGHTFYKLLDDKVGSRDDQSNPATILTKTAIDQLIYAPIMTVVFFVFLRFLEVGWQPDALLATMDRVVPTLLANYCIWPFAHYVSFRWIPTDYRILYNNVISIAWITWLSMFAAGSISIDMHALTIQAQHWVNTLLNTADTSSMVGSAMDGLQRSMGLTPYYSSTSGLEVTYESLVKLSQARFVSIPPAPWQ